MSELKLTERAMLDLVRVREYSRKHFGNEVAARYISDVQSGLLLIKEHPGILQARDGISEVLSFYPVQKHNLVCTTVGQTVIVLTVTHCQIDLIAKLAELEPKLLEEAEILLESLKNR